MRDHSLHRYDNFENVHGINYKFVIQIIDSNLGIELEAVSSQPSIASLEEDKALLKLKWNDKYV